MELSRDESENVTNTLTLGFPITKSSLKSLKIKVCESGSHRIPGSNHAKTCEALSEDSRAREFLNSGVCFVNELVRALTSLMRNRMVFVKSPLLVN